MLQTITFPRAPESNAIGAWTSQAVERGPRSQHVGPRPAGS